MEYFEQKVSDLRALCEECKFSKDSKESKVFSAVTDILEEMSQVLDGILSQVEEEEETYEYAFICPNCKKEIEVSQKVVDEEVEISCPGCGNIIAVCATDFGE